jgi:ankyrin repeat protein
MKNNLMYLFLCLNSICAMNMFGMDQKPIDKPKSPTFNIPKSLKLGHDKFEDLLACNAVALRAFVVQNSTDIAMINDIERTLRIGLLRTNHDAYYGKCDADLLQFARLIAYRSDDCRSWVNNIEAHKWYDAAKIIKRNRYLANYPIQDFYYTYMPLQYVLHKAQHDKSFASDHVLGMVRTLLKAGANPNAVDQDGNSSMHYVSTKQEVDLLLEFGGKHDAKNKKGNNPLMHIYSNDRGNVCRMVLQHLLNAGTDPNQQNNKGDTILHKVVKKKDAHMCDMLLRYGAFFMICNKNGRAPIDNLKNNKKLKKEIEPYIQKFVWWCLQEADGKSLQNCLEKCSWIDFVVSDKQLVQWADQQCSSKMVKKFRNILGAILSYQVATTKNMPIEEVKRLLFAGASLKSSFGKGYNVLGSAIARDREDIAEFLINHGAVVTQSMLNRDDLSDGAMRDLLQKVYDSYGSQECCICYEGNDKVSLKTIPCINRHKEIICGGCQFDIMKEKKQCPMCYEIMFKK